ncbi:hypothetical protein TWF694_005577 [Orbilia ellipsospora]|uniref:Uncharacterized protein n=1 Tax=Orbilia ellipsospora TaxID=2528407 RepID=A0AAV9WV31_9PEZI
MSEDVRMIFGEKPRLCLILHVLVMKICEEKFIRQPDNIMNITVDLGCCEKPLIKQLPFTFTWSDKELYVTVSSSRLRVYRVDLSGDTATYTDEKCGTEAQSHLVKTPKEIIFLPRSARNRKVLFQPPSEPGKLSMVIIGPRPHQSDASSIALYLSDQDLGGWVRLKDKELAEANLFSCHFNEMHEYFDAAFDCDIIPMIHDKF